MPSISTTKTTYRAGSAYVPAESGVPQVSKVAGSGSVSWSDNGAGGSFATVNSTTANYTPANKTQIVTITGSDGTGSHSATISVLGTFPINASWFNEEQLDRETTIQKAVGGTKYMREEQATEYSGQLDSRGRSDAELALAKAFWRFHRKITSFHYLDLDTGVDQVVKFASPLKWKKGGAGSWDIFVNVLGNDGETLFDLEPPAVALVTPASNATVSGGSVLLSATITDNVAVASLRFMVDGVPVGSLLTTAPWQINWNSATVLNGKRVITALGIDSSGNQSYAPARIVTVSN